MHFHWTMFFNANDYPLHSNICHFLLLDFYNKLSGQHGLNGRLMIASQHIPSISIIINFRSTKLIQLNHETCCDLSSSVYASTWSYFCWMMLICRCVYGHSVKARYICKFSAHYDFHSSEGGAQIFAQNLPLVTAYSHVTLPRHISRNTCSKKSNTSINDFVADWQPQLTKVGTGP